jgi:hypothetical protein
MGFRSIGSTFSQIHPRGAALLIFSLSAQSVKSVVKSALLAFQL